MYRLSRVSEYLFQYWSIGTGISRNMLSVNFKFSFADTHGSTGELLRSAQMNGQLERSHLNTV